jgi:hypothetical protein
MALAITGVGGNSGIVQRVGTGVALDPDAAAWIAQVEAADGQMLEPALVTAYNEFFIGCKADASPFAGVSNFDAIKASCIMAGARTLAGALVPLRGPAPTNFNFVAGDYTRATGLKGNGADKYLSSGLDQRLIPVDSRSMAVMVSQPPAAGTTEMLVSGIGAGSSHTDFYVQGFDQTVIRLAGGLTVSPRISQPGFSGGSRSTTSTVVTRTGAADRSFSISSFNTSLPAAPFTIFGRIFGGGLSLPTSTRISFYSIGEAINLAALDARLTTLMSEISTALV